MYDTLARRAILAALEQDWERALTINLLILSHDPDDIDALNRASRAYLRLGDIENAVTLSKRVLSKDPLNSIAYKCLARCSLLQTEGICKEKNNYSCDAFLEIPGRTKIVSLVNLCESTMLARLDAGDNVQLVPKMRKVLVTTCDDIYIGRLPDDLANRMIYFIKTGNEYQTFIKSVTEVEVKVFIKETRRATTLGDTPSFPVRY